MAYMPEPGILNGLERCRGSLENGSPNEEEKNLQARQEIVSSIRLSHSCLTALFPGNNAVNFVDENNSTLTSSVHPIHGCGS